MFKFPSINRVIRILITSDFFLQAGWGLLGPIFAIFLTQQIQGGSLQMVGMVAAVYWISKSLVQPFFAKWLDKLPGEKDDFRFLLIGMYIANLVPLGYVFASQSWHIYLLEFIRALAMAWVIPAWAAIFTRHIDQGKEAFSWSLESTGIGIGAGLAGALGGWMASVLGFEIIFILTSVFGLISSTALLAIRGNLFETNHFKPAVVPLDKIDKQF